jgi:hypothetical protein
MCSGEAPEGEGAEECLLHIRSKYGVRLLTVVEMEEARELIVEVNKSFFHEKTRMEIRFDKTANSTEEMQIRYEPDVNAGGGPIISSWIDFSNDKIYLSLGPSSQQAYGAASFGSYIKITEAEYTALQTNVTSITVTGVTNAIYTSIGSASNFGEGRTGFTNIVAGGTPAIPANTYVFAFKFYFNGTNSSIRFYSNNSISSYTNFTQIGGILPRTTVGNNYYVLKGVSAVRAATNGNLAAWCDSIAGFGVKPFVANGVRFLANTDPLTPSTSLSTSLANGIAFAMQALTTTTIQWVT